MVVKKRKILSKIHRKQDYFKPVKLPPVNPQNEETSLADIDKELSSILGELHAKEAKKVTVQKEAPKPGPVPDTFVKENQGEGEFIETGPDKLFKLITTKGKVSMVEAKRACNVDEKKVEEWATILEDHKMIKVHYPAFGKPIMFSMEYRDKNKKKNGKNEKDEGKDRGKIVVYAVLAIIAVTVIIFVIRPMNAIPNFSLGMDQDQTNIFSAILIIIACFLIIDILRKRTRLKGRRVRVQSPPSKAYRIAQKKKVKHYQSAKTKRSTRTMPPLVKKIRQHKKIVISAMVIITLTLVINSAGGTLIPAFFGPEGNQFILFIPPLIIIIAVLFIDILRARGGKKHGKK